MTTSRFISARLIRRVAVFPSAVSLVIVLIWAISRIISDRFLFSQYIFWVPSLAFLIPAVIFWLTTVAIRTALRQKRSPIDWAAGLACLLLGLHLAILDYRLHNQIFYPAAPSRNHLRIVNWNASGASNSEQIFKPILAQSADIVICVDVNESREWFTVAKSLHPDAAALQSLNMKVMSKFPILRHAALTLEIPAPEQLTDLQDEERRIMRLLGRIPLIRHAVPPDGLNPRPDSGRAWYLELDTTDAIGRSIVIWVIDMPSDIRLSRMAITRHAWEMISSFDGQEIHVTPEGYSAIRQSAGFPPPDFIMGDFNISRRSRSLQALTQNFPHAHSLVGSGHAGTYPRHRPLVHIDHIFVGPSLRPWRYDIIDPGAGSHRMQVIDVSPR